MLSTLAQTCAALAAFVGFVGLNHIQFLQQLRTSAFENISARLGRPTETTREVLDRAKRFSPEDQRELYFFVQRYERIGPQIQHVTRVLVWFEATQLFVIFVSLIGFTFLNKLTNSWLTSVGLMHDTGHTAASRLQYYS